jgi:hypothetical protein
MMVPPGDKYVNLQVPLEAPAALQLASNVSTFGCAESGGKTSFNWGPNEQAEGLYPE